MWNRKEKEREFIEQVDTFMEKRRLVHGSEKKGSNL
jgi:hypothetical protein